MWHRYSNIMRVCASVFISTFNWRITSGLKKNFCDNGTSNFYKRNSLAHRIENLSSSSPFKKARNFKKVTAHLENLSTHRDDFAFSFNLWPELSLKNLKKTFLLLKFCFDFIFDNFKRIVNWFWLLLIKFVMSYLRKFRSYDFFNQRSITLLPKIILLILEQLLQLTKSFSSSKIQ